MEWVYTDRHGGTSAAPYDSANLGGHVGDDSGAVAANRTALAAQLGLTADAVRYMDQVHGDSVAVLADADTVLPAGGTDALVTAVPGVALAVLVADCVPVLMADPEAGVVSAVHAGRPGLRNGVALRALEAMVDLGADPRRTTAWLGPSVCPACYEVPDEMRADVVGVAPAGVVDEPRRHAGAGPARRPVRAPARARRHGRAGRAVHGGVGRPLLLPAGRDDRPVRRGRPADVVTEPDDTARVAEVAHRPVRRPRPGRACRSRRGP